MEQSVSKHLVPWFNRMLHKLSSGIESSWHLLTAIVEDKRRCETNIQDVSLQMLYGMAIVRFVNVITEKKQVGIVASPLHGLAATLNIPLWIVDVRHDATHGEMPSLALLRAAALKALTWLKEEYWNVELENMKQQQRLEDDEHEAPVEKDSSVLTDNRPAIADCLINIMQKQFHKKRLKSSKKAYLETKEDEDYEKLTRFIVKDPNCFVEVFVSPGYLLFTREQLRSLSVTRAHLSVPLHPKLHAFWFPVIRRICQAKLGYACLGELLVQLRFANTTFAQRRDKSSLLTLTLIMGWIEHLSVQMFKRNKSRKECVKKHHLRCLLHCPNKFTGVTLKSMLPLVELMDTDSTSQRLTSLVDMYCDSTKLDSIKGSNIKTQLYSFWDLADSKMNFSLDSSALSSDDADDVEEISAKKARLLSRDSDAVNWLDIPLGSWPGAKHDDVNPFSLDLPAIVNNRTVDDVFQYDFSSTDRKSASSAVTETPQTSFRSNLVFNNMVRKIQILCDT